MGTSLSGLTPKDTYPALLKTSDNTVINSTLKTISDGSGDDTVLQLSTLRVGIKSDSTVTTQTSSVIQATTLNSSLVIAPNGTGALIADIPDGLVSGGNARGANAVDLQLNRNAANEVASGNYSFIGGGIGNKSTNIYSSITGGESNTASGAWCFIGNGFSNTASTNWSTISGGQTNTASTNSHATVVGGLSNTSSGQFAISGGQLNNASGQGAVTLGTSNTASSNYSTVSGGQSNTASTGTHATVVGGSGNTASGQYSVAGGASNTASGNKSTVFGTFNIVNGAESLVSGLQNTVSGIRSFATGYSNNVGGGHNIAVGWGNTITGGMSGVIGTGCSAGGNSSFANGDGSQANGAQSFAQGNASSTGTANSSAFGSGGYTSLTNQQALGNRIGYLGDSQTSKVVYNIATGQVSSGGTYTFVGNELIIPKNLSYGSGVTQAYLCTAKFIYSTRVKTGIVNTINIKDCFTAIYNFAAKSTAGSGGALIGSPTLQTSFSDANLTATVIAITIGESGEILFSFTPPTWTGGGTIEFRGTLSLEFTEIGVYQ